MTSIEIDKLLEKIEHTFQDELECLTYIKPEHYSTYELLLLRDEWKKRHERYLRFSRIFMAAGYLTVIFLVTSFTLFYIGYVALSRSALVMMFVCLIATIGGFSWIMKNFGAGIKQDYLWRIINQELEKRKKLVGR